MVDGKKKKLYFIIGGAAIVVLAAVATTLGIVYGKKGGNADVRSLASVLELLDEYPIIDGHNDFPWNLRKIVMNDLRKVDATDLTEAPGWKGNPESHTDFKRMRAGKVGTQFWVAYVSCDSQYKDAVAQTFEQIDVIKRLAKKYPNDLEFVDSVQGIEDALKHKKIGSLIGLEGGHSVQFSYGVLRSYYDAGVRYLTLTHSCNTPWADASPVDAINATLEPQNNGLSEFGLNLVDEMNRMGMLIDLSHVSSDTMRKVLQRSRAPVIFSHSGARGVYDHHRNVPDDVLQMVKTNGGIVMVNFYPRFLRGDRQNATIQDVVDHLTHIKNVTGPEHVGIGSDFDGVDEVPIGLEDSSKYPELFLQLGLAGWTAEELQGLARGNFLRVFRAVEEYRNKHASDEPQQDWLKKQDLTDRKIKTDCITANLPDRAAVDVPGKPVEEEP